MAQRLTAQERRADVLAAATAEFARSGYHGTSTEVIAERAGISQPYLFRLFGTKKELFLACVHLGFDRVHEVFRHSAADRPAGTAALEAMGAAYVQLLPDRELLLLQLQAYAASADDDIRAAARERYAALRAELKELAGASDDETLRFLAQGMLLNVAAALELDPQQWLWETSA